MTRQANCVISAQRTLPLPPPHLGPLTIIIGPPFPMRHECVYFVNCANMCHDPSRLLFRSCAENCSGRATDRTTRSLSFLSTGFGEYLPDYHPRWWLPLPRAERAVRVINMADILFNPLGRWFSLARFYRAESRFAIIRRCAWCSVNILECNVRWIFFHCLIVGRDSFNRACWRFIWINFIVRQRSIYYDL